MSSPILPYHWSTNLVLLAKNSHVWLYQLSEKYKKPIKRLSDVPDEELAELASQGITGIWLIGLWERSIASQTIKRLCGNPQAYASAYSLRKYRVARELGGARAVKNLQQRALTFGIRIGSDMVPNHMAIDSDWVLKHPDWFLSTDTPPYPAYTFTGPDLSPDPAISIQLEDHYYDRSDAAVVFQRRDNRTGKVSYIYHGNDGTSMPWNDTAQLDFTKPVVRRHVLATTLQVAKYFPIIRFDAAMTLTRHHFHRLWFPPRGANNPIPSREKYRLDDEAFNKLMRKEFWREVVDAVAKHRPDTLLLAEAFWFTEGIFVQDLNMHRVYYSAFMHMLRDEDNSAFRRILVETLAYDPTILQHYAYFMNNPDEQTAVEQFGKGDKYFGVCAMLCTLPGMPMFGHGQLEGYTEKYGMEFKTPYFNEQPDLPFKQWHQKFIFPLLSIRHHFTGVENFNLFDFRMMNNWVNESVFSYANGIGAQRTLIIYHNKYRETEGWLNAAVPQAGSDACKLLIDCIPIAGEPGEYILFEDMVTNKIWCVPTQEFAAKGLHLYLNAYRLHVFYNFRYSNEPC